METNVSVKACTATGTVFSIIPNLQSEDFVRTIILATVGAVVSFTVSLILRHFMKKKVK